MNDSRYRRLVCRHHRGSNHRSHLSYLPHLSGTFSHQVVYHLLQLRYLLAHIEQNGIKNLPFTFKAFTFACSHQCGKTLYILCGKIILQDGGSDLPVCFNDGYLLGDVLQLAHVTGPRISQQFFLGILRQLNSGHPVFLCKVCGKLTEQQEHIVPTFTQRGNLDRYRIQPVI